MCVPALSRVPIHAQRPECLLYTHRFFPYGLVRFTDATAMLHNRSVVVVAAAAARVVAACAERADGRTPFLDVGVFGFPGPHSLRRGTRA